MAEERIEPKRLPLGSPCTNCGKCCTNPAFMGTLQATGEDVKRPQARVRPRDPSGDQA